jgi:hypothetical protein
VAQRTVYTKQQKKTINGRKENGIEQIKKDELKVVLIT